MCLNYSKTAYRIEIASILPQITHLDGQAIERTSSQALYSSNKFSTTDADDPHNFSMFER